MTTADAAVTADITADAVILDDAGLANDMLRMAQWSACVTADRQPPTADCRSWSADQLDSNILVAQ